MLIVIQTFEFTAQTFPCFFKKSERERVSCGEREDGGHTYILYLIGTLHNMGLYGKYI